MTKITSLVVSPALLVLFGSFRQAANDKEYKKNISAIPVLRDLNVNNNNEF